MKKAIDKVSFPTSVAMCDTSTRIYGINLNGVSGLYPFPELELYSTLACTILFDTRHCSNIKSIVFVRVSCGACLHVQDSHIHILSLKRAFLQDLTCIGLDSSDFLSLHLCSLDGFQLELLYTSRDSPPSASFHCYGAPLTTFPRWQF